MNIPRSSQIRSPVRGALRPPFVGQITQHRLLYMICLSGALITSYSLSELGLVATLVSVGLLLCGMLVWRGSRPQDFLIVNYLPRLFITVMWTVVFFIGYLVVRRVQPTNYRAYDLAALAVWFSLMSYSLWTKNRLKKPR
jgi:hypothetical protein